MKLNDLITKYPNAFAYQDSNFPFALFGFECGDGWASILEPVSAYLEELNTKHENKVLIQQVKEKFGSLRFYCSWEDETLSELIRVAEEKSFQVCEICGNPGTTKKILGWVKTTCDLH